MEIKEIKLKKRILEEKIVEMVLSFENETEMEIGRISMSRIKRASGSVRELTVQAEIFI